MEVLNLALGILNAIVEVLLVGAIFKIYAVAKSLHEINDFLHRAENIKNKQLNEIIKAVVA